MNENKSLAFESIEKVSDVITNLSDAVWDNPETAYLEFKSTELQCEALEKLGFTVEKNLAGIETAFKGTWGSGKPVISFLGEFDALPSLSQEASCNVKKPVEEGGNGHGCGHCNLGAGSMAAATALKEYMEENALKQGVHYKKPSAE